MSGRRELEHLQLTSGQRLVAVRVVGVRRPMAHPADHHLGHRGVEHGATSPDGVDGTDQLLVGNVLHQIAACARLNRLPHVLVVVVDREDDNEDVGEVRLDPASRLDTVHDRHTDVEEHDVGLHLGDEVDGLGTVDRLSDDLDRLVLLEDLLRPATNEAVIVGYEDCRGGRGHTVRTLSPSDGPPAQHGSSTSPADCAIRQPEPPCTKSGLPHTVADA